MNLQYFFHRQTGTLTYLVSRGSEAVLIDTVLDFQDGKIGFEPANEIIDVIRAKGLSLKYILETHIHADHLSAASYIRKQLGGKIAVGNKIEQVYKEWIDKLDSIPMADFDVKLDHHSVLDFAGTSIEIIDTPGHTPDSITYKIDDFLFVGDTLFSPARGTSRVDFPGGSASDLYQSIEKIYEFPDAYHIQLCHDYPDENEPPICDVTVGDEKATNIMLNKQSTERVYVENRLKRDAQLSLPKLIEVAVPFNLTHQLPAGIIINNG
ncbi:MBL fold metallo-hydrolase [Parashewanella spongiae]|uniref:MBL fold metallo-hydrolase n=1 Tax=Parashewanella spongiae TaxID=342950 RepID=A0A3A6TEU1_9GAMM|nr:MBL fold metallo-hydrolase [Parashewanella spongiae]MCL1080001.1 MBL fold metallo-hydrolase [Parashewanella spongiae]RJY05996.1 MBL fold metallo-hydrolase [Parashewanella spongiae]